tara:strand:+ start:7193 stop:7378 length:186 start_codon:yes stop_codon:yes gene_type:complete
MKGDKMKITEKELKVINRFYERFDKIKDLVDDLGWEHQRMSSSGQESYEKLCEILGWKFES